VADVDDGYIYSGSSDDNDNSNNDNNYNDSQSPHSFLTAKATRVTTTSNDGYYYDFSTPDFGYVATRASTTATATVRQDRDTVTSGMSISTSVSQMSAAIETTEALSALTTVTLTNILPTTNLLYNTDPATTTSAAQGDASIATDIPGNGTGRANSDGPSQTVIIVLAIVGVSCCFSLGASCCFYLSRMLLRKRDAPSTAVQAVAAAQSSSADIVEAPRPDDFHSIMISDARKGVSNEDGYHVAEGPMGNPRPSLPFRSSKFYFVPPSAEEPRASKEFSQGPVPVGNFVL